jgi:hypothetical protein
MKDVYKQTISFIVGMVLGAGGQYTYGLDPESPEAVAQLAQQPGYRQLRCEQGWGTLDFEPHLWAMCYEAGGGLRVVEPSAIMPGEWTDASCVVTDDDKWTCTEVGVE